MLRLASLIRSAMSRRRPMTLISDVSAETSPPGRGDAAAGAGPGLDAESADARSSRMIRPPGPDPTTVAKSIPASRARRRLAGEVIILPATAEAVAAVAAAGGVGGGGRAGRRRARGRRNSLARLSLGHLSLGHLSLGHLSLARLRPGYFRLGHFRL